MKKLILLSSLIIQFSFLFAQNQNITRIWGSSLKEESVNDIFEVNSNTFVAATTRSYNFSN